MVPKFERSPSEWPLFCARCSTELHPGSGDHYIVYVEAIADPAGPQVSSADLAGDLEGEIKRTIGKMADLSATEAMHQVHRQLRFGLCVRCYRRWIDNPTG